MGSDQPSPSLEDAVLWGYRLLLDREPENAEIVQTHARAYRSVREVRRMFMQSEEFAERAAADGGRVPNSEVPFIFQLLPDRASQTSGSISSVSKPAANICRRLMRSCQVKSRGRPADFSVGHVRGL